MKTINELTYLIIGAAIEVHRHLGPGLLESAYEACLIYELTKLRLKVQRQVELPIIYKEIQLERGYRIDLLVDERVVIELKAVDSVIDVHKAQVLSYLKFTKCEIGLLLNFNVTVLKDGGITRIANNYQE